MRSKILFLFIVVLIKVDARRECIERRVPNADTVCVCNATYCDDFPTLKKPTVGFATVYESTKSGQRFKESQLKFSNQNVKQENSSLKNLTVVVDNSQKYQSINGFGAAFTDTTGQMLKTVNQSLADLIIESYFSPNGIEYSMARIPIGGSDYSDRAYSYDDVEGDLQLKHFALQKEDLEWKIPFIQKALKISAHKIKLFGSPWSPPAWMKTNNNFSGGGQLKGTVGGEYYQAFAEYFVKFLNEYKSHDINLWGVTVENEPGAGLNPHYTFNCLNLTPSAERDFIKMNLGPALEKGGYGRDKFNLMIMDDGVKHIENFTQTILSDKEAAKYVSGIAYHWYDNHPMSGYPDQLLTKIHNKYSQYFLLNTEACFLEGADLGRWDAGERYAYDIIRALNNYVSGWVEWNMALDMNGGPRWNEKKGFGGAVNIDSSKGEAYKQPAFYAIGHFSKFVSPDSVRTGHKVDKTINGLSLLTVKRPDNQTVLVALNANNEDIILNINDSNNYLSNKISARSIQSYIW